MNCVIYEVMCDMFLANSHSIISAMVSLLVSDFLWADDTFAQKRQNEKEMRNIENNLRHNLQHLSDYFVFWCVFYLFFFSLFWSTYVLLLFAIGITVVESSLAVVVCSTIMRIRLMTISIGYFAHMANSLLVFSFFLSFRSVAFGYSDCYVMCTQFWLCHKSTKTSKWSSNRITMPMNEKRKLWLEVICVFRINWPKEIWLCI